MTWFKLMHGLFGWRYVLLVDESGDVCVRRAWPMGGEWLAERVGLGVRTVALQADGSVRGGNYCVAWKPLLGKLAFGPATKDYVATCVHCGKPVILMVPE